MKISAIITTFKEPDCLDLCIHSALTHQENDDNQLVVVVDGTARENADVIKKYQAVSNVKMLILEKNVGMCMAQNIGVQHADNAAIILANDDHVFPKKWDSVAAVSYDDNSIVSFGVIQPKWPAKYVLLRDYGEQPSQFNIDGFIKNENALVYDANDRWFAQFPCMMNRFKYIALGGFDVNCPGGVWADNDLFIKAKIMGMKFRPCFDNMFYHFASVASSNDGMNRRVRNHYAGQQYMKVKWGTCPANNNSHYLFSDDDAEEFKYFCAEYNNK